MSQKLAAELLGKLVRRKKSGATYRVAKLDERWQNTCYLVPEPAKQDVRCRPSWKFANYIASDFEVVAE